MAYNENGCPAPTLLLTRPRAVAARFALEAASRWPGAQVAIAPLMEIVALGETPALDGIDGLIFTSAQGVARAGQGLGQSAWCVGTRTAETARQAGFDAAMAGETADELVAALIKMRPEGRLLHLHGVHQRGDIAARLSVAGIACEGRAVYDQRAVPPDSVFFDALASERLAVPLFSPRSAELFAAAARPVLGAVLRRDICLFALSAQVSSALPHGWHGSTAVAARPDAEAMLDRMAEWI